MKIDFAQPILDPNGKALENLTLAQVAVAALNSSGSEPLSFDQAVHRGNLALRIADGAVHDVTPEDVALIRSLLSRVWSPVVVARAAQMLDG